MTNRRDPLGLPRRLSLEGRIGPLAAAIALGGVLGGCGGAQKPAPANPGGPGNTAGAPPVDRSRCKAEGKRVVTADLNGDDKADVWKYYVPNGQGSDVLTCKQIDYNHDGKIDSVYYYDDAGTQTTLEEFDMDFDGRFEETVYYVNGKKVRIEMDMDFDGKPDVWKFFEDEKLVRMERDTNSNGRVDQWEYYEGGKLDRIGYDTTGSGKVDRWDRAPEGADQTPGGAPPSGPAPALAPTSTAPAAAAPVPAPTAAAAPKK
jgi:antitoxin component YwqK of YwqJK toxin-antitoxin module